MNAAARDVGRACIQVHFGQCTFVARDPHAQLREEKIFRRVYYNETRIVYLYKIFRDKSRYVVYFSRTDICLPFHVYLCESNF